MQETFECEDVSPTLIVYGIPESAYLTTFQYISEIAIIDCILEPFGCGIPVAAKSNKSW